MPERPHAGDLVKPGDVVGGKYRVERVLGAGGMGLVVAAVHVDLGQTVALKFILPDIITGKDSVERFLREARAVARLKSEHVARVFDVGRDDQGRPYMVLELLEGCDLATLVEEQGLLPVADAVEYVLQACEGLVEAHAAGIVHRDLKPANLFVTRRFNGAPLVKLLDFGIAKATGAAAAGQVSLTNSQAVIGSPLYMAPEQMRSARAADMRSDVWSLGVVLYELIGGQCPFDGATVTEVCIRVVNDAPPPLATRRPGLDPRLVDVVMRCLEKDPARRWQSVAELAAAIEPFARSTQRGGGPRPWSGPAAARTFDATGPTPRRATLATLAGESAPPARPTDVGSRPDAARGGSTAVSWDGSAERSPASPRARFRAGLAVGAFVALAAAMAVGALRWTTASGAGAGASSTGGASSSAQAPPVASGVSIGEAASVAPTPEPLAAASPDAPVDPSSLPDAPEPAPDAVPPVHSARPSTRPRPRPAPAPTSSARAPASPTGPSEKVGPNGAPIVR